MAREIRNPDMRDMIVSTGNQLGEENSGVNEGKDNEHIVTETKRKSVT